MHFKIGMILNFSCCIVLVLIQVSCTGNIKKGSIKREPYDSTDRLYGAQIQVEGAKAIKLFGFCSSCHAMQAKGFGPALEKYATKKSAFMRDFKRKDIKCHSNIELDSSDLEILYRYIVRKCDARYSY